MSRVFESAPVSEGWRSLVPVNALVLAQLAIGLVNNVLIAASFGLTRNVDAFYAAMMVPTLFMILCIDYLGKNFLPVLAQAKLEGEKSASQMVSTIVTTIMLVASVATMLLVTFSHPLFSVLLPGFDEAEIALVSRYFWIMAPAIVFMATNAFHEYVCQYDEDFISVMAIRTALPGMNLAALVLLGPLVGEYCLPIGYLIGNVTMFVLLARRAKYEYRPRITVRAHLERKVFTNSAIVMSTGIVARTRSVVVNLLASSLGGGAISALAFTAKLTEPLERAAFSGARMFMFSRTTRLFADRKEREVGRLYTAGLRTSFLLLVPLLWWIALNGGALVEGIFARGQFTPRMTTLVAATLLALVPSVLFVGVGQLLANAFYAMGRVKVPALITPLGMLVFVAAAVPLSRILGTQGIALATTVASVLVFGAMLVCLSRVVKDLSFGRILIQVLGYVTLGGAVMAAFSSALRQLPLPPLGVAFVSLPVGLIVYVGVLAFVRDRTFATLLRLSREWLVARGTVSG